MYEAFVLVCLIGKPISDEYCNQLADIRGPYMTHDQCLARVYEIQRDLPVYKPDMEARAYRCDKFTPKNEELT